MSTPIPPVNSRSGRVGVAPPELQTQPGFVTNTEGAAELAAPMPNDPSVLDIEDLRAQSGLIDPASPDFNWDGPSRANRWLQFSLLIGIPLGLYHFSLTVRQFVDAQIEYLSGVYKERFPPTPPNAPQTRKSAFDTAKAEEKKETKNTTATITKTDAKPSATATAVASTPAAPAAAASKLTPEQKVANAMELLTILNMREQIAALMEIERLDRSAELNRRDKSAPRPPADLPAKVAQLAVKDIIVQLELPPLPQPPKWTTAPATVAEAKSRLDALANFRSEYELAVAQAMVQLKDALKRDLTPALEAAFNQARTQFDTELPERMRLAKVATSNALEVNSLIEFADISRSIALEKAHEWNRILYDELARQKRHLDASMRDVLSKQDRALDREFEPDVTAQLQKLEDQRAEIARLEKELGRKKQIEKTGERVHALTSLLIRMEENLQRDTKVQLFDASGAVQPAAAPAWAHELEADWARMVALSKEDPALYKLVTSIPASHVSASTLASPSTLRHAFVPVQRNITEATFLPPGEELEVETNPAAALYAKVFTSLSLAEGQALRPAPTSDVDRLNNAAFYLQKSRDLASAIRELDALESPKARAEAAEWLQVAKQRIEVEATVWKIRQNIQQTAKTYAKKI